MEHEVFVPVPVASLRRTLGDPARVARCVPGFQQDADAAAGPLAGRLKLRIGGHTITYRGALVLRPADGGSGFSVTGEGVEARGTGSAKLALTIGLTESDGGTTIGFAGTVSGEGRIVDQGEDAALAAAHRLLDRLTQQLVTESLASRDGDEAAADAAPGGRAASDAADRPTGDASTTGPASVDAPGDDATSVDAPGDDATSAGAPAADAADAPSAASSTADAPSSAGPPSSQSPPSGERSSERRASQEPPPEEEPGKESVFDAPVPPPSLDPSAELEFTVPDEPPAEAAHARRTMIGRSTEEVDHAPPRGRYAPVPSPDTSTAGIALRWAAPAAALAIASAVVVGRALRRRR
ncbi:SRPBCC domain-containing protein [Streptomyces sp. B1I3]|uniref:SRPBCC domain-containing protein n=1 Tax=Streptomyces sp. B1I3 TaxID=3042264 RepID=UPI002787CD22|nr:SRPBCC domain-containing protein [Streptomyces sp. B1I3]MDQ0795439.1 carbon monoxide dehydrogenase subunit G [Streptomyces sp. B1I3]